MKGLWGIVVNPKAGRGRSLKRIPAILDKLKNKGIKNILKVTNSLYDLKSAFDEFDKSDVKGIIGVGGDGTQRNLAPYLIERDLPLLILPMGTGNDYPRSVYGDIEFDTIINSVADGEYIVERVDIGVLEVNGRRIPFLNGMGMGIDGELLRRMDGIPILRGDLLYLAALFRALSSYKPSKAHITTEEGELVGDVLILTVGVGKYLGGSFLLHPLADLKDGLLDLSLIETLSPFKVLKKLPLVVRGKHLKEREVHYVRTTSLEFKLEEPLWLHTDGDLYPEPVVEGRVKVEKGNLQVIVPKTGLG